MWGLLLHHIVDMLIISIKDPERFFAELFQLTICRIRYGVRPEYLTPFGAARTSTMEELLGEVHTHTHAHTHTYAHTHTHILHTHTQHARTHTSAHTHT